MPDQPWGIPDAAAVPVPDAGDDLTRRAIIAAHGDCGCGQLNPGEEAIVALWRADAEDADRLVSWKDTAFRARDEWRERAEATEAAIRRAKTVLGGYVDEGWAAEVRAAIDGTEATDAD